MRIIIANINDEDLMAEEAVLTPEEIAREQEIEKRKQQQLQKPLAVKPESVAPMAEVSTPALEQPKMPQLSVKPSEVSSTQSNLPIEVQQAFDKYKQMIQGFKSDIGFKMPQSLTKLPGGSFNIIANELAPVIMNAKTKNGESYLKAIKDRLANMGFTEEALGAAEGSIADQLSRGMESLVNITDEEALISLIANKVAGRNPRSQYLKDRKNRQESMDVHKNTGRAISQYYEYFKASGNPDELRRVLGPEYYARYEKYLSSGIAHDDAVIKAAMEKNQAEEGYGTPERRDNALNSLEKDLFKGPMFHEVTNFAEDLIDVVKSGISDTTNYAQDLTTERNELKKQLAEGKLSQEDFAKLSKELERGIKKGPESFNSFLKEHPYLTLTRTPTTEDIPLLQTISDLKFKSANPEEIDAILNQNNLIKLRKPNDKVSYTKDTSKEHVYKPHEGYMPYQTGAKYLMSSLTNMYKDFYGKDAWEQNYGQKGSPNYLTGDMFQPRINENVIKENWQQWAAGPNKSMDAANDEGDKLTEISDKDKATSKPWSITEKQTPSGDLKKDRYNSINSILSTVPNANPVLNPYEEEDGNIFVKSDFDKIIKDVAVRAFKGGDPWRRIANAYGEMFGTKADANSQLAKQKMIQAIDELGLYKDLPDDSKVGYAIQEIVKKMSDWLSIGDNYNQLNVNVASNEIVKMMRLAAFVAKIKLAS